MADELYGRAIVRVDAETRAADRSIRDFSRRADAHLGNVGDAIDDVTDAITALRAAASNVNIRADLDDHVTAGAATLQATLSGLAAQGPLHIPARIDDDTAAGAAAIRATINELRALGPVTISVDVDGGTQAVAAGQALRSLRQDSDDASRALGVLGPTASMTGAALGDVRTAAAAASGELRTLRTRATAAARALDSLRENALQAAMALRTLITTSGVANRHLNDLNDSTTRLRTNMTALRATVRTAGSALNGVGDPAAAAARATNDAGDSSSHLAGVLNILKLAALPVAASLTPIALGAGAAAVAVGALGAAVIPQISALSEATEAEKKYQDAIKEHGRGSEQAATAEIAYLRTIKDMPPATRQAGAALGVLKDEFKGWSDGLAKFTMVPVTKGLQLTTSLLPKLTPLVTGASTEFSHFLDVVAGASQSEGFGRFTSAFAEFAEESLAKATNGLVRFTQAADAGEVGSGVREFLAFAREQGPAVADTFRNVVEAGVGLAVGLSDVGVSALTVVNALAQMVNAIPPSWIGVLVQAYAALKLVRLGIAGVTAAASAGAVTQLTAFGRAARFGGVGSAISGVTQRMSTMGKVAGGLGVLGVAALAIDALADRARGAPPNVDKLTTSLKALATTGKFTGELKNTFGSMDGFVQKLGVLRAEQKLLSDSAPIKLSEKFGFGAINDTLLPKIDDLVNGSKSMGAMKDEFKAFDQSFAQLATSGHADLAASEFKKFETALKGAGYSTKQINALFPEYKAGVAAIKEEQRLAAQGMGLFGEQAQATGQKLEMQKASADGLRQSLVALNDVNRQGLGGMIGFEAALDATSKAAKENAGALRMKDGELVLGSEKSRAAATALSDLAQKTDEAASSARASGQSWSSVNSIYQRGRTELIKSAMQMGLTRKEATALAAQILKIPDKTTRFKGKIEDLEAKVKKATKDVKSVPASKRTEMKGKLDDLQQKLGQAKAQLKTVPASKRSELRGKIDDLERKVAAAKRTLASAKDRTVGVKGRNLVGGAVSSARKMLLSVKDKTATVHGRDRASGVVRGILGLLASVRSKTATITTIHRRVESNASPKFRAKGGPVPRFAGGGQPSGMLRGPGTGTSDSIPMWWGSDGEYIVNARSTSKYLPLIEDINADRLGAGAGQASVSGASGGTSAGVDVGRGLAAGLRGQQGAVESQAAALAAAAVMAIRRELQISSPSKKTRKLGRDTGAGFIKGLTGTKAKIDSTAKAMAKSITAAFKGTGSRTDNRLVSMISRDNKRLQKLAGQRDALAKKISDARKFSSDLASKARATGSLGSIVSDDFFAPAYVEKRMKSSLSAIKSFSANVTKLQKKGLSKSLLRQILEMGPDAGAAFAKALAGADKETIKRYNKNQADLDKASKSLGNKGADMLYDSGKKAGKGLLAGLKAQQKDIEQLMLRIAKGMQKAIRRALKIKSPSQVMADIGRLTMAGLGGGILREVPMVERAMGHVATAIAASTPRTATPSFTVPNISRVRASRAQAQAVAREVHLHVHNSGVIGSQMELDNWLTGSLDRLNRQRRLPAGVGAA